MPSNTDPTDIALQTFSLLTQVLNLLRNKGVITDVEIDEAMTGVITGYQSELAMGKVTSGAPILEAYAQHRRRV